MKRKKLFASFEENQNLLGLMLENALFSEESSGPVEAEKSSTLPESEIEQSTDYLTLGKKLMTLAKSLMPRHREYTSLGKKIGELKYCDSMSLEGIFKTLSKVLRRQIRSLEKEVYNSEFVKELRELIDYEFYLGTYDELFGEDKLCDDGIICVEWDAFSNYEKGVPAWQLSKNRRIEPNERTLYLYCPAVFRDMLLVGMQMGSSKYKNATYRTVRYIKLVDISYALAWLIILSTVKRNLSKEDYRETVAFKNITNLSGHSLMCRNSSSCIYSMKEGKMPVKAPLIEGKTVFLYSNYDASSTVITKSIDYLVNKGCKVFYFSDSRDAYLDNDLKEFLSNYFSTQDIQVLSVRTTNRNYYSDDLFEDIEKLFKHTVTTASVPIFLDLDKFSQYVSYNIGKDNLDADIDMFMCLCENWNQDGESVVRSTAALPNFWYWSGYSGIVPILLSHFLGISEVMEKELKTIDEEREANVAHAKSFETKRNIPKKILDIMENSVLNERFGYIEYDEMCDTEKIETVNLQLLNFVNTYFPNVNLKGVSLRFRRLGNHRANGLYYPAYRCIAVELSHPSSFVHEFGHMLDYTNGMLSNTLRSQEFKKVYDEYVSLLDRKLGADDGAKALFQKGGKSSKYNYYTKETEVFARCFELYISASLKMDNTIMRSEDDYKEDKYVYHADDKSFVEIVVKYFDSLPVMEKVLKEANNTAA